MDGIGSSVCWDLAALLLGLLHITGGCLWVVSQYRLRCCVWGDNVIACYFL